MLDLEISDNNQEKNAAGTKIARAGRSRIEATYAAN